MTTITASDGTEIYYKDWGEGPVVTFSHGWPLSADVWDGQLMFLAEHGFRGSRTTARPRPFQPGLVGQRYGRLRRRSRRRHRGARPARYCGRRPLHRRWRGRALHRPPRNGPRGQGRADLCGTAEPLQVRDEPRRPPAEVFAGLLGAMLAIARSSTGTSGPVLRREPAGFDRFPGRARRVLVVEHAVGSEELLRVRQVPVRDRLHRGPRALRCPDAVDPRRGRPGRPVPQLEALGRDLKNAKAIYYPGAPHGLTATHQDRVNADLLAFLQG